jgi:hypothetical protein
MLRAEKEARAALPAQPAANAVPACPNLHTVEACGARSVGRRLSGDSFVYGGQGGTRGARGFAGVRVGCFFPSAAAAEEEERVRVVYSAPAGCADEQAFIAAARARTEHGNFDESQALARMFEVEIVVAPAAGSVRAGASSFTGSWALSTLTGGARFRASAARVSRAARHQLARRRQRGPAHLVEPTACPGARRIHRAELARSHAQRSLVGLRCAPSRRCWSGAHAVRERLVAARCVALATSDWLRREAVPRKGRATAPRGAVPLRGLGWHGELRGVLRWRPAELPRSVERRWLP